MMLITTTRGRELTMSPLSKELFTLLDLPKLQVRRFRSFIVAQEYQVPPNSHSPPFFLDHLLQPDFHRSQVEFEELPLSPPHSLYSLSSAEHFPEYAPRL